MLPPFPNHHAAVLLLYSPLRAVRDSHFPDVHRSALPFLHRHTVVIPTGATRSSLLPRRVLAAHHCHPDRSEPVFSCVRFLHAGSRSGGIAPPLLSSVLSRRSARPEKNRRRRSDPVFPSAPSFGASGRGAEEPVLNFRFGDKTSPCTSRSALCETHSLRRHSAYLIPSQLL